MTHTVEPYSQTWKAVTRVLNEKRKQCVNDLIAGGGNDEALRANIYLIDELLHLEKPPNEPPPLNAQYI
jgi:hypothetical protein